MNGVSGTADRSIGSDRQCFYAGFPGIGARCVRGWARFAALTRWGTGEIILPRNPLFTLTP